MSSTNALSGNAQWVELLWDDDQCFQRVYMDSAGTVTFVDIDLDATAYAPVGTPECREHFHLTDSVLLLIPASGVTVWPANTIHSISLHVINGTCDVNGVILPEGTIRNVNGDEGLNNISTTQTVGPVTGEVLAVITAYA